MGMNTILILIAGIVMTAIIGSQVAPSMIEQIKATKVEAKAINNQEVIFEAVKRYITMKQKNPTSLRDIIDEQFLNAKVNDNGFDGGYEIEIDGSKGLLKIKTTIKDPKAQEIFLNSFKNKFIPTRVVGTTNEFETTFVIPTDIMHGRGLFMTGIPVQATPPTDTSLKYWYDTSGKEVALRMYDPTSNTWKKVAGTSGSGSISEGALVDASGNNFTNDTLPTTNAEVGEIKYAYDSATNSIQEYVYIGDTQGWVVKGGGGNQSYSIIQNGATRYWSNNTYATSCLGYIKSNTDMYRYIGATGDGVYRIDPDGSGTIEPFDVYCDMTTDGGGWMAVYTSNSEIQLSKLGNQQIGIYGNNGYRSNFLVKKVKFKEVLFVNHEKNIKYSFTRDDNIFKSIEDYGLKYNEEENIKWTIKSPTNNEIVNYKFHLMICDNIPSFQTGFMFTGEYNKGGKICNGWESDFSTWYFRHDGDFNPDTNSYRGVAFAENGHFNVSNKLVSVLLR